MWKDGRAKEREWVKKKKKKNQSQKSFDLIFFIGNNHKRFRFPGLMKNAIDLEVGRCNSSETERAGSESGSVSTFWAALQNRAEVKTLRMT